MGGTLKKKITQLIFTAFSWIEPGQSLLANSESMSQTISGLC